MVNVNQSELFPKLVDFLFANKQPSISILTYLVHLFQAFSLSSKRRMKRVNKNNSN